jgi:hypothetical protein
LERIGYDVGKRPIIANGSGEDKLNAFFYAAVKYARSDKPAFDSLLNPPGLSYGVDGPEVVFMALAGANCLVEVNA